MKTRDSDDYGSAFEAVSEQKQYKISRTALRHVQEKDLFHHYHRFDIVGINLLASSPEIELIKDAFELKCKGY